LKRCAHELLLCLYCAGCASRTTTFRSQTSRQLSQRMPSLSTASRYGFCCGGVADRMHPDLSSAGVTIPQAGPLRRLQNASGYSRMHRGSVSAMLSSMSDALMQRNVTRSHLEHQIAAAVVLKSSAEYRYWYGDRSPLMMMSWSLLIRVWAKLQDPCVCQVPHARRRCVAVGRLVCGHDGSLPCVRSIRAFSRIRFSLA